MSTHSQARKDEARILSLSLATEGPFSFLRLCDRELDFLLQWQQLGAVEYSKDSCEFTASCMLARGSLGLDLNHADRLQAAYEGCDMLDMNLHNEKVVRLTKEWDADFSPEQRKIKDPGACGVIECWIVDEFPKLLKREKVVICAAESSILRELVADPEYLALAGEQWSGLTEAVFIQPINDGRSLSQDLDAVKAQLVDACEQSGAGILCLSLGGAAKVLANELARENGLRCVDVGSMMRGLTYAGSCGNSTTRSMHNPIFFRIPFPIHMAAVERAFPDASPEFILAKAHAQLCLDLQRFVPGEILMPELFDPASLDLSHAGKERFKRAMVAYQRRYRHIFNCSPAARSQRAQFKRWRVTALGSWQSGLYPLADRAKQIVGQVRRRLRKR